MLDAAKKWIAGALRSPAMLEPVAQSDSLLRLLQSQGGMWADALKRASGKRVLIATSMACYNHASVLERALAVALTLRGARVDMLLCDSVLPSCQMTKIQSAPPELLLKRPDTPRCGGCQEEARALFDPLGVDVLRFGNFLAAAERDQFMTLAQQIPASDIAAYRWQGMAIGEHAHAGALRYFARGTLAGEAGAEPVLRRFFLSALLTAAVIRNLLKARHYDVAVFHHGIYTPQGIIGEVCRANAVRVVNWNPSYRRSTFIFSHDDTYHHTMISEPVSQWENMRWSDAVDRTIMDYLNSRRIGSGDWIWFHEHPEDDALAIGREFGIDWEKPCIGLLTSVMWDAQLHYRANAFPDMLSWMRHTVEYFERRPDLQLLIRVHPAEVRGMVPSRQRMTTELAAMFPQLPSNVFVIPPEHPASTYTLMDRCNATVIFNTKSGIELACLGIPVIVAGEAWIRGKGFSLDASSPSAYDAILDRLPMGERMSADQIARAKRYAYHFFYRRMIEIPFVVSPEKYSFDIALASLNELEHGHCAGLDVVCKGILDGAPFVVPLEEMTAPGAS